MNTTHAPGYTTVRDIWHNMDFYSSKICKPAKKKSTMEEIHNTTLWLLQPESSEDLPQPVPDRRSAWANTGKAMFWVTMAIAIAFFIAQLGS